MKKFLLFLFAIILSFSAFTTASFAEGVENTNADSGVTDEPIDIKDSMYAKWVDEHPGTGIDYVELDIEAINSNDVIGTPINMYIKDGKIAMEIPYRFSFWKLTFDTNSGKGKAYLPFYPFFYISLDSTTSDFVNDSYDILFYDYSDIVLESVGKVQESGTEYYVEKFKKSETNAFMDYYFKDGELVRVEIHNSDSSIVTAKISYDVSDKDVDLPFYAFIDLSPLITLFETLVELI